MKECPFCGSDDGVDNELKNLTQFKDHVVNMWATDKPEMIPDDIKHLFFEIK